MDMSKYYDHGTREEWREAIKKLHNLKGQAAGHAALEMCKQMLAETPDPTPQSNTPCRHAFVDSTRLHALECRLCGMVIKHQRKVS